MHQLFFVKLAFLLCLPALLFSGEIVHLKFDAGLEDSAGGRQVRNIGTPVSYTADRFGRPEGAVLLKKGSRISLGSGKDLSFARDGKPLPFTVEWFQRYDVNGSGVNVEVLKKGEEYRIAWNNKFRFRTDDSANRGSLSRNGATALKYGEWTHIAVVFDHIGTGGIRFYQDGEPVSVLKDGGEQGKYLSMTPSRASLIIGAGFEGALDDLVIHDRVLAVEEIRQRMLPQVTATPGTPVIDGKLDDSCWKNASPITHFLTADNTASAKKADTTAFLTYDNEAIYTAFRCGVPADAEAGEEGSAEVFLSPVPAQGAAYRFVVSADGKIRASRTDGTNVKTGAAAAVSRSGGFWNAEVRIPYQDLDLPLGVGKRWGVNLVRNDKISGQTCIWSSASVTYDSPDRFGMMICRQPADLRQFMKEDVARRLGRVKKQIADLPAQDAKEPKEEAAKLENLQDMNLLSSRLPALEAKVQTLLGKNAVVRNGRIEVRIGHSLQKISADLKPFGNLPSREVGISVARNEAESFQLVVSSADGKPLENISVSGLELKNGDSSLDLSWHRVGYVKTLEAPFAYLDAAPGFYADPLLPPQDFSVGEKSRQPLWFTVQAPENAVPGVYRGHVRIAAGDDTVEMPVTVRVRSFVLPRTLASAFGNYTIALTRYYNQEIPLDKFVAFCNLMNQYRMGSKSAVRENIRLGDDCVDFSRVRQLLPEVYPYDAGIYRIPGNCRLLEDTERYQNILKTYRGITEAWRKENLPETMFLYGADEPSVGGKHGFSSAGKAVLLPQLYRDLKKIAPYPVMQTLNNRDNLARLVGAVDIWCPLLTIYSQNVDFFQKRLAKKETLWLYTCNGDYPPIPNFYIERPGIEHRIMFWQAYREGATGFLYWAVNWWAVLPQDWQKNPVIKSDKGRNHGDGVLFYPAPDFEIWPSIRAGMVRDGIEDYEYLSLLKKLVAELKQKNNDGAYSDLIKRAEGLCNINEITTSMDRYTKSPEKLFAHREKVGDMIEEIGRSLNSRNF